MNILTESLYEQGIKIGSELIQKHRDLGMRATGKWEESIEIEVIGTKLVIRGEDYTEQLTKGRAPGKRPPITPLENWVKAKLGKTGSEATGIAFAVANKIAKEGTDYHPQGTDLIDGVLTPQRIEQMEAELGQALNFILAENLKRQFENEFA